MTGMIPENSSPSGAQTPTPQEPRRASPARQGLIFGTLAGVAIAVVMGVMMTQSLRSEPIEDPTVNLPALSALPALGPKDAPLIRVAYDYKCPVCASFEKKVMPELLGGVVKRGEARLQAMPYPFLAQAFGLETDDSVLGAQAGMCVNKVVGPEVFFRFTRELFLAQGDERQVWITPKKLQEVYGRVMPASQAASVQSCVAQGQTLQLVQSSVKAVQDAGISATPTVVVGNRLVRDSAGRASWALKDIEAEVRAQTVVN